MRTAQTEQLVTRFNLEGASQPERIYWMHSTKLICEMYVPFAMKYHANKQTKRLLISQIVLFNQHGYKFGREIFKYQDTDT